MRNPRKSKRTEFDQLPDFSDAERARRWGEIRWRMDLAGLDGLLIWGNEQKWQAALANNRYVAGQPCPGVIYFPLTGDPVVWTGFPHDVQPWGAMANSWLSDVRSGHDATDDIISRIRDAGVARGRIGVVGLGQSRPRVIPESVAYSVFSRIQDDLPGATFIDADWILEQARLIKSTEEISAIRKASEITLAMYDTLIEVARPGVREFEVTAAMLHTAMALGGEEEMIWLSSGSVPPPHGKRPPASPRYLESGDIIVVEYHGRYRGYLSGIECSVALGEPAQHYHRIQEVCRAAQERGISRMQPGAMFAEAVEGFRGPIKEAQMASVECGLHGHGLASPEFPSCMYGGDVGSWEDHGYAKIPEIRLQENMVFATASDVYDPAWRTDTGLMLGRLVHITAHGPVDMTKLPMDLHVTE